LDVDGVGFNFTDKTFYQDIQVAEHIYRATIKIEGLDLLLDPVCMEAVGVTGCYGLTTPEGEESSFATSFSMSHLRSVPEPSSIFLLSLALFGIVSSMRNKHI